MFKMNSSSRHDWNDVRSFPQNIIKYSLDAADCKYKVNSNGHVYTGGCLKVFNLGSGRSEMV